MEVKMKGKRNPWLLLVLLLFGALVGGIAGEALSGMRFFEWMSFGGKDGYRDLISFTLKSMDFRVIKIGFDFALRVNAGSIIGIVLSIFAYMKL
jgi:hypothetical protein